MTKTSCSTFPASNGVLHWINRPMTEREIMFQWAFSQLRGKFIKQGKVYSYASQPYLTSVEKVVWKHIIGQLEKILDNVPCPWTEINFGDRMGYFLT